MRRSKGEQANKQRMAVGAPVFTQPPRGRTPEEVIESLLVTGPRPAQAPGESAPIRGRPEAKGVWASLRKGKTGVISEVAQAMARRDPERKKRWGGLTDGERALQQTVRRRLPGTPLGLDLQHVLEQLGMAAYAFPEEGPPAAQAWVKERALRLLRGEGSRVVKGLRQSATKRQLKGQRRKAVEAAAASFYRNRCHMRYQESLRAGWPIATGVVEGAWNNLVKDRMERSGMRWTPTMAEAMRKLRAAYLSGDFEEYWAFYGQREHKRLHPLGYWRPVNTVEQK